jgi:hypothetical protein
VYWRTPNYNYLRYVSTAVVALFYGSIYWQVRGSAFLFGRTRPVAVFRLYFDLEHSSTQLSNYLCLTVNGQREFNGQRG